MLRKTENDCVLHITKGTERKKKALQMSKPIILIKYRTSV